MFDMIYYCNLCVIHLLPPSVTQFGQWQTFLHYQVRFTTMSPPSQPSHPHQFIPARTVSGLSPLSEPR